MIILILSAVTDNGQFRILVSSEPENLKSNSNAKIFFDVTDIFLKNKPVATNYEFSVTQNERIIFEKNGISTDSRDEHNVVEFMIPNDVSGIVNLNFKNLDDNELAKATIPIVIDRIYQMKFQFLIGLETMHVWWADGQIDDKTFIQGIEYIIQNKIILIPQTQQETSESQEIPSWIKNNAAWWAAGQIDDKTFVQGLEFLIQNRNSSCLIDSYSINEPVTLNL